jgi:hypothetical protein
LRKHSAFTIERGEACELESSGGLELLLIALPILASEAAA